MDRLLDIIKEVNSPNALLACLIIVPAYVIIKKICLIESIPEESRVVAYVTNLQHSMSGILKDFFGTPSIQDERLSSEQLYSLLQERIQNRSRNIREFFNLADRYRPLVGLLIISFFLYSIALAYIDKMPVPPLPTPSPSPVTGGGPITEPGSEEPSWPPSPPVTADDGDGKKVTVVAQTLVGPFSDTRFWKEGSQSLIETEDGKGKPIEDFIAKLNPHEPRPFVIVGLASFKNSKENPDEELKRAEDRENKCASVAEEHFKNAPIWSVNLGYYEGPENTDLDEQRRVVILVVTQMEKGANLSVAIPNALKKASQEKRFIWDPAHYSNLSSCTAHERRTTTAQNHK